MRRTGHIGMRRHTPVFEPPGGELGILDSCIGAGEAPAYLQGRTMTHVQSSTTDGRKADSRRLWSAFRARYLGLAVFWACSMLTFRSSITLSGQAQTPEMSTVVVLVSFLANATVLLIGSMLLQRDPDRIRRVPWYVFPALIMVGLVLLCVAGHLSDTTSMVAFVLTGAVMTGMGYGFFWGSWAQVLGSLKPSQTGVYAVIIFFVSALIFVTVSTITSRFHVPSLPIMELLTVVASVCLWKSVNDRDFAAIRVSTDPRRTLAALISIMPLVTVGMVISFFFGFVWEMTVMSMRSADAAHFLPMFANCIAAVILIVIIAVTHRRFEPTRIFLVIIPAIALLFIAFPFFFDTRPVLINVAMTVCYGMFDVILWYSVATAAYDFSTSGYVVGGVARSASIVSRLTGICIGYLVMKSMDAASSSMIVISAGALYLLAVIAVLYAIGRTGTFTLTFGKSGAGAAGRAIRVAYADDFLHDQERGDEGAGDIAVSEGAEDPSMSVSAARCAACAFVSSERTEGIARQGAEPGAATPTEEHASEPTGTVSENVETLPAEEDLYGSFADDFGLTRREAEILPYLHRGRSARVIASSLYVAESTVRTHIRHILEKTGQHSKQELIDFMESHAQD